MEKPMVICKDYRVFRLVCTMYGFDPRAVNFVSSEQDARGRHPVTPVFIYSSAGWPEWYHGRVYDELNERFKNRFHLPEINPARV